MGLVYLFLGITWLVMLACNWRDLLRVQFWVGGVIVLGKENLSGFSEFLSEYLLTKKIQNSWH